MNNKRQNLSLFQEKGEELVGLKKASEWASRYLNRNVSTYNISYLLQYGRIKKYESNGYSLINIRELKEYYDSYDKEKKWKEKLGEDLNWRLSFVEYKESERTKHVHRLHPYKGKFIPQLVEYFLDSHTDEFKRETFFGEEDIVLDPFCGSGTTLVQANELGMNAVGIDVSAFNAMISAVKIEKHNFGYLREAVQEITFKLKDFQKTRNNVAFEERLLLELSKFNNEYFPSPYYKNKVREGKIDEIEYTKDKETKFLNRFNELIDKYNIKIKQDKNDAFLDKWFLFPVREEMDFVFNEIKKIKNKKIKKILAIILSRTVRSCRATTHADLGTLKDPVTTTYYCKKHGKICKPLFSIGRWWQRYSIDTINRLQEFDRLRTDTFQICLIGDSRTIDIYNEIKRKNSRFAELIKNKKIKGIFSSPPYVGLINYHEQHAYSYEMF